jgi:hypothetical protein
MRPGSSRGPDTLGHSFARVQVHSAGRYRGAGEASTPEESKKPPQEAAPRAETKPPEETRPEAEQKAPGTTIIATPTRTTYTVPGSTLKEATVAVKARKEAGSTEPRVSYTYATKDGVLTDVRVTVNLAVTMPEWPGRTNASEAARVEWDRFYQSLDEHEQGHVDLTRQTLSGLAESLVGKTEAEAKAAVEEAEKKLNEAYEAYDVDTDHGRKRGTIIDDTIQ